MLDLAWVDGSKISRQFLHLCLLFSNSSATIILYRLALQKSILLNLTSRLPSPCFCGAEVNAK